jgi:endonuclease III
MNLKDFVKEFGRLYSDELGIDREKEPFKWFLASILFGARISEQIAKKTYYEFEAEQLTTPYSIYHRGWDGLVEVLDRGGYVRYDFKTADKLLEVTGNLLESYNGDLELLHNNAADSKDLEERLKGLGKGIGDVTISIFLREMRNIWEKADTKPQSLTLLAAKNLGIDDLWTAYKEIEGIEFANFEIALLRLGKDFCKKDKCSQCLVINICKKGKN